ncbi:MAG: hypothetical protein JO291_14135, partial [Acidimicrobiia bacterium]|nr:hypothetical protein [Acidimicrobiia bacterium]
MIMTALLLIPLLAFAGLAVDVGSWYARGQQLQRAADAAALAGAALAWWALRQRRSALWGLAAVALPGAYVAMRISCADLLAGGLALVAAVLLGEGYWRTAVVVGVGAVLTKESMLIFLAGVALSALLSGERKRALLAFILAPAAAAALLSVALLLAFPHAARQ